MNILNICSREGTALLKRWFEQAHWREKNEPPALPAVEDEIGEKGSKEEYFQTPSVGLGFMRLLPVWYKPILP